MQIIQRIIPKGQKKQRPGYAMAPKFITVHNTANASKGANAEMHARYLLNGAGGRTVGWHFTVDDRSIYQHLPTNENGWHAGDGNGAGNRQSIGIEICENVDGDFEKAVKNAQWLVEKLMRDHGIPKTNVVPHKRWTGKNCPRKLLARWDSFIGGIGSTKTASKPNNNNNKSIAQMADEVIAGKHGSGHESRRKSLGISQAEYEKVRAEVNRRAGAVAKAPTAKPSKKSIEQMINEVLIGKHGNGHAARQKSLGISSSEYQKVKQGVNNRLTGAKPTNKSISQMATEVIQGKHGNGHEARRKSLGISQAEYEKVRAEVNRRT